LYYRFFKQTSERIAFMIDNSIDLLLIIEFWRTRFGFVWFDR